MVKYGVERRLDASHLRLSLSVYEVGLPLTPPGRPASRSPPAYLTPERCNGSVSSATVLPHFIFCVYVSLPFAPLHPRFRLQSSPVAVSRGVSQPDGAGDQAADLFSEEAAETPAKSNGVHSDEESDLFAGEPAFHPPTFFTQHPAV